MYAEDFLKAEIVAEVLAKKWWRHLGGERWRNGVTECSATVRLACQAFSSSQTCYEYKAKLDAENDVIADWLVRLTKNQHDWGFSPCFLYLRNLKNFK